MKHTYQTGGVWRLKPRAKKMGGGGYRAFVVDSQEVIYWAARGPFPRNKDVAYAIAKAALPTVIEQFQNSIKPKQSDGIDGCERDSRHHFAGMGKTL